MVLKTSYFDSCQTLTYPSLSKGILRRRCCNQYNKTHYQIRYNPSFIAEETEISRENIKGVINTG